MALGAGHIVSFIWVGITASFAGYLRAPRVVGDLIAIALAGVAIWRRNVPAALAAATLVVFVFVATGRTVFGIEEATASRYSYFAVGLALPLIGQVLTAISRSPQVRTALLIALGVVVVLNASELYDQNTSWVQLTQAGHQQFDDAAYLVDHGARFEPQAVVYNGLGVGDSVSAAQLTELVRHGQVDIPTSPGNLTAERTRLSVYASPHPGSATRLTFVAPQYGSTQRCVTLATTSTLSFIEHNHHPLPPHPVPYVTVHLTTGGGAIRTSPVPGLNALFASSGPTFLTIYLGGLFGTVTTAFEDNGDHWLTLPSGGYTDAILRPGGAPVTVCQ